MNYPSDLERMYRYDMGGNGLSSCECRDLSTGEKEFRKEIRTLKEFCFPKKVTKELDLL